MPPRFSALAHEPRSKQIDFNKPLLLGMTALASFFLFLSVPWHSAAQGVNRVPSKDSSTNNPLPFPATPVPAVNRPDVLDLELAVTQAELISMAVRLVDVTETKIVHGGRDVQVRPSNTGSSRFRILKGIFARGIAALDRREPGHLPVCRRV